MSVASTDSDSNSDDLPDGMAYVDSPCPNCTDGTVTVGHLIGDGQPGVQTRVESETKTCPLCEGTNRVDLPTVVDEEVVEQAPEAPDQ